ncbi:hypothetical protein BGZ49_002745 [Haplosporangium sp. Z 27]|nr:hypothetical protein BGZ49_002745 [Haplosporangium sp. Z 27]
MSFPDRNSSEDSELYQYFFKQNADNDELTTFLQNSVQTPDPTSTSSLFNPIIEPSSTSSTLEQQHEPLNSFAQPTLLPTTSFSYRQLSPNIPPPMPMSLQLHSTPSLATASSIPSSATTSETDSQSMDVWMQRFQQLQQLQQKHHYQQHQLLSATLLSQSQESSSRSISPAHKSSSSERSVSPHDSSDTSEKDAIYPSPPMRDDESIDSDDDDQRPGSPKPSAAELKKMTSKERRQLRNKLSARNFRVRRKEYIVTLEKQVKEARKEAADLQRRLIQSELNCQFLRQELETTRLSQSLFADGRMSKEHANLLASLLNPGSESFPSSNAAASSSMMNSTSDFGASKSQQTSFMSSMSLDNNFPIDSNSSTITPHPSVQAPMDVSQASLQAFIPFDGDWGLLINRAEVPETTVDPKDESSKREAYEDLLSRYEAAKKEADLDEQMRMELKAHVEKKLAQTYMVSPKEEMSVVSSKKSSQEDLLAQTLVYMMMIHLTQSLFEAATMSKSDLVNVYQTMDEPLRAKINGQEEDGDGSCKFTEWREAWIRKCWPSFYNNRRRLVELSKNNSTAQKDVDVVETARKIEENVKGKTVEVPKVNYFVRHYLPTWLKGSETLERERLENLDKPQRKQYNCISTRTLGSGEASTEEPGETSHINASCGV